ncbi:hypothetical protein [Paenibacillus sp. FJAT-26967]|uniref:hypothetical protein n=1 Tax=Paenibacillus sp. FJAT-26967 TaxID=1729690 RepID=UPI000837D468|nr:hypothetical protein [Paenibacillus sp. FJAT-26967]
MKDDFAALSRQVGFYRRHQVIPTMTEVEQTWQAARSGNPDAAIRLLDWRRHCLLAKTEEQTAVMQLIMQYARLLFNC